MSYDGYEKYDEKVARNYDRDRQGEAHWGAEFDFVKQYAIKNPLGRVLDLPVGTGRLLSAIASAQEIVGGDISLNMLSEAERVVGDEGWAHVRLQKMDALAIEFPDGHFDVVLCFRLIHLIPADLARKVLAELARVTRGTLLLQVYVAPRRRFSGLRRVLGAIRPLFRLRSSGQTEQPWSHIRAYFHTGDFIEDGLRAAGFSSIRRHWLGDYQGLSVEVFEAQR